MLVEVHSYYQRQIEIARHVDWVYDFALPPLVLHAFFNRTARTLKRWIEIRPVNALTVLDTHDGIGVIDIGADAQDRTGHPGLVPESRARPARAADSRQQQRREPARHRIRGLESRSLPGELHVLRRARAATTSRYLLARAIQFFLPGIPQVYYVGLLAGHNDMPLLRTDAASAATSTGTTTRAGRSRRRSRSPSLSGCWSSSGCATRIPPFRGHSSWRARRMKCSICAGATAKNSRNLRVDLRSCSHRLQFSRTVAPRPSVCWSRLRPER